MALEWLQKGIVVWGSASSSSREHHCFPQVHFFSFVTTIAMKIDCILPWSSLVVLQGVFFDVRSFILGHLVGLSERGCFCWLSRFPNSVKGRTWSKTEGLWHTLKETLLSLSESKWQLFSPWVVSFSSHSFSKIYQVLINVVCSALASVLNHIINRYYSWLIRLNCLACVIFSIYKISLHSLNILCKIKRVIKYLDWSFPYSLLLYTVNIHMKKWYTRLNVLHKILNLS